MDCLKIKGKTPNPRKNASFLSKMTYWYMNDIFKKASKTKLEITDLHSTLDSFLSDRLCASLEKEWEHEMDQKKKTGKEPSLIRALMRMFKLGIFVSGIFLMLEASLNVVMPYFVGFLIEYLSTGRVAERSAFIYAAIITLCFLSCFMMGHQSNFYLEASGLKMRTAMTCLLYKKATRLTQGAFVQTSTGQIVNMISGDSQKLLMVCFFFNYFWIAPLQLIAVTAFLYQLVGVSAFPGVAVMALVVPVQFGLSNLFAHFRQKVASLTDERVKVMSELISWMRTVKMYTWEGPFSRIIQEIRRKEIHHIFQAAVVRSFNIASFICTSYLAALAIFATHYARGKPLNATNVFSTLALLQVVRFSVTLFLSMAVQFYSEAAASAKRIQDFLQLDEMNCENVVWTPLTLTEPNSSVLVKNVVASWTKNPDNTTLKNIQFELHDKNPLLMVVGPVGAGKTSILMAICGEIPISEGSISVHGSVAYVPQRSWVFSGTVQQNILFGQPYDAERYSKVVNACALVEDFRQLPDSDMTLVGERGVCISGGQKARINLARAAYRNADVYLLDDPLSAVDAKVGKHIFDQCICGLLKDKIRILCTHQVHFLQSASQILCIHEGKQVHLATFDELSRKNFDVQSLVSSDSVQEKEWDRDSAVDFEEVRVAVRRPRLRSPSSVSRKSNQSTLSHVNPGFIAEEALPEKKETQVTQEDEEETKEGNIGALLYVKYLRSGGGIFFSLLLFVLCLSAQLSLLGVDWWIGVWSGAEEALTMNTTVTVSSEKLKYYFEDNKMNNLYVYVGATSLACVIVLSSVIFFFNITITASRNLHDRMLGSILKAPIHFFDTTSTGRILNRFAKDTFFMDEELPWTFQDFSQYAFFIMIAGVVSVVNVPYILVIVVPLAIVLYILRSYYLVGARDIKRLEGISRSPMFTHLSSTLEGLSSIRAYKAVKIVTDEFNECQDHCSDGWLLYITAARWFAQRLDSVLLIFIAIVIFGPLVMVRYTSVNPTLAGLSLVYALQLNGLFQWCVRQSAQVENLMTSVERIGEYCDMEPEADNGSSESLTRGWPKYGIITAEGASFAHDKSLPYVLKTMFFCIRASEKVGVIGRTGAGKSSLIAAMFRTGKLMGTIRIDGVATSDIKLSDLRSSMSVIPQDPVLFIGTLRRNIDLFDEFEDPDIWEVLEEVQLKDEVFKLENKIYTQVSEGGSNFSVGQRQLFCLARALLLRKKILFIDEATANVDQETDAMIQETIREKFRDCTVVTVAHRLNTIMDCDRIMVMKAGKIVQFDEPCELFKEKDGEFRKLVEQTGRVEAARLELLANEAKEVRKIIRERTSSTYPGCKIVRSKTKEEIMEMFGSRVVYETSL